MSDHVTIRAKCLELAGSLTVEEIYLSYYKVLRPDTKFDSFSRTMRAWKRKSNLLLEKGDFGFVPHATTVQIDSEGKVVQAWIKSKDQERNWLDEILECIKNTSSFEPIERNPEKSIDRMLEITFDDMHFGIAPFEYYRETLLDTLKQIEKHKYKEINVIIGEDLLHTDDLKGNTSNQTFIGPIDMHKAYGDTLKFYFNIMDAAIRQSDRVRVTYSMGNHSETLSWTILQVLKVKYPQAEYDDSFEHRKVITFGKIFIVLTHGDTIKGSLKDVKELFVEENKMKYARALVAEIHIGHYHVSKETGDINGCVVRRLSTKVPADKWHKKKGFTTAVKRFTLFEYSSDKLISMHYV